MRGSFFAANSGSSRFGAVALATAALVALPCATTGCVDQGGGSDPVEELRAHFPEQQQAVLGAGEGFARAAAGFAPRGAGDAEPDAAAPVWSFASSMSVPRYAHSAISLRDGRVLVFGGANDTDSSC